MKKYIIKTCKKCNVEFRTRPFYNKEYCVKCSNAIRMKEIYDQLHPNKRTVYVKGNQKESKKQWAKRNHEKIKEIVFNYRYKNSGILKDKEWAKANPEKVKAYNKKYRQLYPEKVRERHLRDRRANPEKYKERSRLNYYKNPEKCKESCRKRRVRKLDCDGFHTCKEFQTLKNKTGNICLCCKIPENELKNIYKNKKYWNLTEDHIIPLIKNGSDNIDNIQPLCYHCNSVKNNKIISLEELKKIL